MVSMFEAPNVLSRYYSLFIPTMEDDQRLNTLVLEGVSQLCI